ncbi:phage tail tip protein J-related protein [Vibrio navarrensis]
MGVETVVYLVAAAVVAGTTVYVKSETKKQAKKAAEAARKNANRDAQKQMFKSAVAAKQIVLGHPVLSGPMVFGAEEGAPNDEGVGEWTHIVVHLAGHPCDDVTHAWLDDELLTRYEATTSGADIEFRHSNGNGFVYLYLGEHTQAPPTLAHLPDWNENMIGREQCFAHIKLQSNPAKWAGGLPNPKFAVRGLKVFDPRTNQTQWTDNPALLVRWYRTALKQGVPIDETYITAANICDELVSTPVGQEKRYRCNYAFMADQNPRSVLNTIRETCDGDSLRVAGRHAFKVGAYYGPGIVTLGEDDIISDIAILPDVRRRDRINTVSAKYTDPLSNWNEVDMPHVQHLGYLEQDGYDVVDDLNLKAVPSPYQAQRLAMMHILTTRDAMSIEFTANLRGTRLLPGSVFKLNLPENQWNGVEFIVSKWKYSTSGAVTLVAKQTKPSHYDFNGDTARAPSRPGIPSLVSRDVPAVTNLSYATLADSNTLQAVITWQHKSLGISTFELSFYKDGEFLRKELTVDKQYRLLDGFEVGQYQVQVVAISYERRSPVASLVFNASAPQTPIGIDVKAENWALGLTPVSAGLVNFDTMYDFALGFEQNATDAEIEQSIIGRAKVITVSNLKANTTYQIAVREVSRWGKSGWYRSSAQTTFNSDDVLELIDGKVTQTMLDGNLNDFLTQVDERSKETQESVADLDISLGNIQQLNSNLALSVLGVTSSVAAMADEYQRRFLNGEAMIGAVVQVDPETGQIINLAFNYADQKFTQAGLLIDGVKASVTIQSQEIKRVELETGDRLTEAEAQIVVQAGLISQKASYSEVNEIIAGAIDAITPARSWQFNTTNEGWTGATWVAGGHVTGTAFSIAGLDIDADENTTVRLRVKSSSAGALSWNGGSQNVALKQPADPNQFEVIILTLTAADGWTGTIQSLEINFDATIDFIEVGKPSAAEQALEDLTARTTHIEQELDPANARWGIYVTQEYWDGNALTLTDVQQQIDAYDAEWSISATFQELSANDTIAKANSAESWVNAANANITDVVNSYVSQAGGINDQLEDADSRLNTAQQDIDALENSITQTVTSLSDVQGALGVDADAGLVDILGAYKDFLAQQQFQEQKISFAYAEQKISANSTAIASQAQKTLELAAFQNDQQATLTQVQRAIANQEQALADSVEQLTAKIETDDAEVLASAKEYTRAAVGYCMDAQGKITSETDAVLCVQNGNTWIQGPLAEYIRNLSIQNAAGETATISDMMQAFENDEGNLVVRGGMTVNNQGKISGFVSTNDGTFSQADFIADFFRIGIMSGENFEPVFSLDSVSKKLVLKGRLILDDGNLITSRDELKGDKGDYTYTEFQFSADGSSWHFPEQSGDRYIRSRLVTNGVAGSWGATTDLKGETGSPGQDATERYIWIKYADTSAGAGLSDNPAGKAYMGIAHNRTSPTESTNPADYAWTKIKGEDGVDGANGQDGQNGDTIFTEFQFSANGSSWHFPEQSGDRYIRSRVVTNGVAGSWGATTDLKGETGSPGQDATERYIWIKYADTSAGAGLSDNPAGKAYMGIAHNRTSPTESTNPADYAWTKIKGEDGADGANGQDGQNGNTIFTEFQFSANGSSWHFPEQSGDRYIRSRVVTNGVAGSWGATTDLKGETGSPGQDATERYIWIKYADTSAGAGLSDNPAGKAYMGIAHNRTSPTESTNPADYAWTKIKGEDGADGANGQDGQDGKPGTIWGTLKLRDGIFPSDALATADFTTRYGRAPMLDDMLTYVSNDGTVSSAKSFNGSAWAAPALRLSGDLITPGTLYGDRFVAGSELTSPVIKGGEAYFGKETVAPFNGYHTRISATGLIETDRISATGGTFDNVTIGQNCDIQGTLTAGQIVGDIARPLIVNLTEDLNIRVDRGATEYLYLASDIELGLAEWPRHLIIPAGVMYDDTSQAGDFLEILLNEQVVYEYSPSNTQLVDSKYSTFANAIYLAPNQSLSLSIRKKTYLSASSGAVYVFSYLRKTGLVLWTTKA